LACRGKYFLAQLQAARRLFRMRILLRNFVSKDRKIIGVEMESYGIAAAVFGRKEKVLLIRGISDFADQEKNDNSRLSAMEGAVRFFNEALRHGVLRGGGPFVGTPAQPNYELQLTKSEVRQGVANNYIQVSRTRAVDEIKYRRSVIQKLATKFSLGELRSFCIGLKVDYDEIKGETKSEKASSILEYVERKKLLTVEDLDALIEDV
jgi:hypothetical protein